MKKILIALLISLALFTGCLPREYLKHELSEPPEKKPGIPENEIIAVSSFRAPANFRFTIDDVYVNYKDKQRHQDYIFVIDTDGKRDKGNELSFGSLTIDGKNLNNILVNDEGKINYKLIAYFLDEEELGKRSLKRISQKAAIYFGNNKLKAVYQAFFMLKCGKFCLFIKAKFQKGKNYGIFGQTVLARTHFLLSTWKY